MSHIARALAEVQDTVAAAAERVGRSPDDVLIVAVTKTRALEEIQDALAAGAVDLGENYVQELVGKHEALEERGYSNVRWHAIGHLQRNKARNLAPFCHLMHSVDSQRLADEISKRAAANQRTQPVLIEVNVAAEASKFGVPAEEADGLAQYVAGLPHVELRGLMAMTPYGVAEDVCRRHFVQMRELAARLGADLPPSAMAALSMGMTQDYEVAVEEGATMVRVGTAIFGKRREG